MLILSIDPGVTTGIVSVNTEDKSIEARQVKGIYKASTVIINMMRKSNPYMVVVIEDFVGAGKRDNDIVDTIKLLGYVQLLCKNLPIDCITQHPQYKHPFMEVAELRYSGSKVEHIKDAYAHLLAYIILNGKGDEYFGSYSREKYGRQYPKGKSEEAESINSYLSWSNPLFS